MYIKSKFCHTFMAVTTINVDISFLLCFICCSYNPKAVVDAYEVRGVAPTPSNNFSLE